MKRSLVALTLTAALLLGCDGSADGSIGDAATTSATNRLDPSVVSAELRHLVPLAERWGIGDDVERAEYIEQASPGEREELRTALAPHHAQITAWLDSFGTNPMSDEAAAFMYMQLALEEMP